MASTLATRYFCQSLHTSPLHSKGNGTPRFKTCNYCKGPLVIEQGLWGVFAWTEDNAYSLQSAVKTFAHEGRAQTFANHTAGSYVVRWIPQ